VLVAKESLQIRRGKLDEGLEEISLLGIVPHGIPESFEYFVAFPPVGEVVEVDPIQVIL
jgi:hypothetical protein